MCKTVLVRTGIAAAMLFIMLPLTSPGTTAVAEEGLWSKQAYSIPRQRAFRVPSPDRKKTVRIEDLSLTVSEQGAPVPGIEGYTLLLPAEIAWAPDSKAFVITANEGGAEEAWFVTVYVLEYDRVNYYEVTAEAAGRFKALMKCPDAGEPDFGAVKWTKESKNLLIVAEVPAHSSCADKGVVRGYIIEIPSGQVLKELLPGKLVDDWGEYLGPRITRKLSR